MTSFETTQDTGRANRPLTLVEPNPKAKLGVWATAIFAAGEQGLSQAKKHCAEYSFEALLVDGLGELSSTKGFEKLLRPV